MDGQVSGDFVVTAAQILYERMAGRDRAQRADRLQPAHRPQPCLEPAVISLDAVVAVLLEDMQRGRDAWDDLADELKSAAKRRRKAWHERRERRREEREERVER